MPAHHPATPTLYSHHIPLLDEEFDVFDISAYSGIVEEEEPEEKEAA